MLVLPSPATSSARRQIIEMEAEHRMPTIMAFAEFAEEGGLIAYGPDVAGMYQQAAGVMMKVLRGQRPGDIPIERPARTSIAACAGRQGGRVKRVGVVGAGATGIFIGARLRR